MGKVISIFKKEKTKEGFEEDIGKNLEKKEKLKARIKQENEFVLGKYRIKT